MIDGETALVVPDGDTNALSAALEQIVTHADLKERLRRSGQRMAGRFAVDRIRSELDVFVRSILSD